MNDSKAADIIMKIAVILRLMGTAAIALYWAQSYLSDGENLIRLYAGGGRMVFVIIGFALDTLLTMLWLKSRAAYSLHLGLYIVFGAIHYAVMIEDIYNSYSGGIGILGFWFEGIIMVLIGIIPFMLFDIGRKKLK